MREIMLKLSEISFFANEGMNETIKTYLSYFSLVFMKYYIPGSIEYFVLFDR